MLFGLPICVLSPALSDHLLLLSPTLSKTRIAFEFAGDIWSVPREGGNATKLTSLLGRESRPLYSPDGSMIAFTGQADGNPEVYVMPSDGGTIKRLTTFGGTDVCVGWAPDGQDVLFISNRDSNTDYPKMYRVSAAGGLAKMIDFPSGSFVNYSADQTQIAYNPSSKWQPSWKRYRGGQTSRIWIGDVATGKVSELPRKNSNDTFPQWVGNKIYFISDRDGRPTLYCYETQSKSVTQLVKPGEFDLASINAGPDGIVMARLGSIEIFDPKSGQSSKVNINIQGDFPESKPQFKSTAGMIAASGLSPSGVRAVFESRGDIYTVPANKGDIKNLTESSGSMERYPAWSPDGHSIGYFSDSSGEYKLVIKDVVGSDPDKTFDLGAEKAFPFTPVWSPDSKKIAYNDNQLNIWILDLETKKCAKVATNLYDDPFWTPKIHWSPDSQWITFVLEIENHIPSAYLYSLKSGKATQVTDGMGTVRNTIFDSTGKYLIFTASTNDASSQAWLDFTSYNSIDVVSNIYVAVLRNDLPSPLSPESDDERNSPSEVDKKADPSKEPFRIDLETLGQRIVALPIQSKNYIALEPTDGDGFLALDIQPTSAVLPSPVAKLTKFSFGTRQTTPIAENVDSFFVSARGDKMLVSIQGMKMIVPTAGPISPGQGVISIQGMRSFIEPLKEWDQMFRESLRIQRDFFYDPNTHGINLKELEAKYRPFVSNLRSREDLNLLIDDMLGEICVGHMFVRGGDYPQPKGEIPGLLGADYSIENGRYRIKRVYNGENWNPALTAPLTQPGVQAVAGDFILEINGQPLLGSDDINRALNGKVGLQTKLKLSSSVDGANSRIVTVIPIASDNSLRAMAWEEDNRKYVESVSGGKIGYFHVPDTNVGGWTNFNRYFYSQTNKEGLIVDSRFNHGGQIDDYMADTMSRPLYSMSMTRYGKDIPSPFGQIYGPKVMLTNEMSGSGGDYFPWHFKSLKIGPVIGHRTWGGLVGILIYPVLMDGLQITAPSLGLYNLDGTWLIENHGVDPDIEVELDPVAWRKGHDSQLDRAIEEVLKLHSKQQKNKVKRPAFQDKSSLDKIKP